MAATATARLYLYAVIHAIETDLRRFIAEHTKGTDPFEFFGRELHATCLERAEKDDAPFTSPTVASLLPYVDFPDHYHLVNRHRTRFPSAAASHIKDVTHKLDTLARVRNRVMHSRPLQQLDFPDTLSVAESLAEARIGPWENIRDELKRLTNDPSYLFSIRIPALAEPDDRVAHNLPTPDFDETGFIGRDDFVEQTIRAILGPYPVIAIRGQGGIGKSAVALKVAYDLLDRDDCPFDLIIWASSKTHVLSGSEIREIRHKIASSLDLISDISDEIGGASNSDPVRGLLDELKTVATLLILDNLETVLDDRIRALLSDLPTGCKILVTSRIGIGAFEFPLDLPPMKSDEIVELMRTLSRVRAVHHLVQCGNRRLARYTERLHNNPGFVKWFVAGVQTGARPEALLANPDAFLDFCLSNIYDYLKEAPKAVLGALMAVSSAAQAEIAHYTGIQGIALNEAINELQNTNMLSVRFTPERVTYNTHYEITEMAEQYLKRNHPLSAEQLREIDERRRQISAAQEEISAVGRRDPYQRSAIVVRSRAERVSAMLLRAALRASKRDDTSTAMTEIEKAKHLTPEYFEVYKVEAIVALEAGRLVDADTAFRQAVNLEPESGPSLHMYSRFLMDARDDIAGAARYSRRACDADPENYVVVTQLARAKLYLCEYEGARQVLAPLVEKAMKRGGDQARRTADIYLQTFLREGDTAVQNDDLTGGLRALQQAREYWNILPSEAIDFRLRSKLEKARRAATGLADKVRNRLPAEMGQVEELVEWMESESPVSARGTEHAAVSGDIVYGKVIRLPIDKTFGFVEEQGGDRVFFHRSAFSDVADWQTLSIGAGLTGCIEIDDSGRKRLENIQVDHAGDFVRNNAVGEEFEGIIRMLNRDRGYGFIRVNAGPEFFFHRSAAEEWHTLTEGGAVRFVVGISARSGDVCAKKVTMRDSRTGLARNRYVLRDLGNG